VHLSRPVGHPGRGGLLGRSGWPPGQVQLEARGQCLVDHPGMRPGAA
jgi:hypothetical protein